ncbi:MAG TPA: DNA recombination protein RmuC [Actinomycetes bacterium]|nr:DNA recombination protein RmuC [Actinomycetes bacterium]
MGWGIGLGAVALLGLVAGFLLARHGGQLGLAANLLERRLEGMSKELDRRLVDLDRRLYLGLDSVQLAQAQAGDVAADVRERVATVTGIAQQVLDHARGLAKLEDLLRPPQARGAFGEVLLEHLLAQGLPDDCWRSQHAFRSGTRVDAVLILDGCLVPVDSKFPLEAFARMATAAEGDAARALHRRAFVRDARRHVEAIADKYIRPDEGTFDFALCYLPSEAVYYEFLREDPSGESPFRAALERRVFPVSPSTFYAYLLSIGVGLRGLRVEANARRVLDALAALGGDLERFQSDFEVVGKHLGNARTRWEEAARRLDRLGDRLVEVSDSAGRVAARPAAPEDSGEPVAPEPEPVAPELRGTG